MRMPLNHIIHRLRLDSIRWIKSCPLFTLIEPPLIVYRISLHLVPVDLSEFLTIMVGAHPCFFKALRALLIAGGTDLSWGLVDKILVRSIFLVCRSPPTSFIQILPLEAIENGCFAVYHFSPNVCDDECGHDAVSMWDFWRALFAVVAFMLSQQVRLLTVWIDVPRIKITGTFSAFWAKKALIAALFSSWSLICTALPLLPSLMQPPLGHC